MLNTLLTLFALLISIAMAGPAWATVYWASPSGTNDLTGGTTFCNSIRSTDASHINESRTNAPSTFGTINAAANCMKVAGDILNIGAGTYSGSGNRINTQTTTLNGLASGTSSAHTIIQAVPGETVTINASGDANGFLLVYNGASRRDWIEIKGQGITVDGQNGADQLIYFQGSHWRVHHLTVTNASRTPVWVGMGASLDSDNIVEYNTITNAGLGGVTGYCVYAQGNSSIIQYNTCNVYRGEGIQFFTSTTTNNIIRGNFLTGGTTNNNNLCLGIAMYGVGHLIEHNVINSAATCGTNNGSAQVLVDGTGITVRHNTVVAKPGDPYGLVVGANTANSTVTSRNNIFVGWGTSARGALNGSTIDASGDKTTGTLSTYTGSSSTYTLNAGSPCIDFGTAITGKSYNGSAPDCGAFETFAGTSASIDLNFLDITMGISASVPALPAAGITGFTVACTSCGGITPTVSSAAIKSGTDSVIRLTISGIAGDACVNTQVWTWSYSGGNVTDSALVGGTINQPLLAASTQAVTEVCSGSPTSPPTSGLHIHYKFDEPSGTTATSEVNSPAQDGTLTGSPTRVTGGVTFATDVEDYVATAYGNGVSASSQDLTVCADVAPTAGLETDSRIFTGTAVTGDDRFYLGWWQGFWGIGIGASSISSSPSTQFAVAAGHSLVCMVANATTDVATLWVNGQKGTGTAAKSYTGFTLSGNFRVGGIDYAFLRPGVTIYEFWLYTSAASDGDMADLYSAWSQASPAPTGTFEQKTHKWQKLRKATNGDAQDITISGTTNGITANIVSGGAIEMVVQVDCTGANCDPTAVRPYFSRNGGGLLAVPDTAGPDNFSFYGSTSDTSVVSGSITCCLTGALTANNGTTIFTASAIPSFDLAQNASIVIRYAFKLTTSATVGDQYCLKMRHQTDVALNTYTPSAGACFNVIARQAGS